MNPVLPLIGEIFSQEAQTLLNARERSLQCLQQTSDDVMSQFLNTQQQLLQEMKGKSTQEKEELVSLYSDLHHMTHQEMISNYDQFNRATEKQCDRIKAANNQGIEVLLKTREKQNELNWRAIKKEQF